ncbi:hypothetical protein C0036_17780 [Streptomyces sp. DJ]|nr:hypothetical protein C0036_17780 [Streptomyces sp. DJ]
MPPYRILPPDENRVFMELQPAAADTLVVSWHKDVLLKSPDHMDALVNALTELADPAGGGTTAVPYPRNPTAGRR